MVYGKLKKYVQERKVGRMVITIIICFLLYAFLGEVFLFLLEPEPPPPAKTIGEIAYDADKRHGYTIYIEEETGYHPYLVLTREYGKDNTVLLLRKYVLDEWQPFNKVAVHGAYYGRSYIDEYLNTIYLRTLERETRSQIEITAVDIMAKTAWGRGANITRPPTKEELLRKVFLLSDIEVGNKKLGSIREGEPLKYFTGDVQRLVTTYTDGERSNWSLRTGALEAVYNHYGIGFELELGLLSSSLPTGVRPAFCMDNSVEIVQSDDIVEEETVYILKRE